MDTRTHALQGIRTRLSTLDRRRTLGAAIAAIGAVIVSIGVIPSPATADSSFVCPDQPNPTYDGVLYTYEAPGSPTVEVGNWPALWVGVGFGDGSDHILYGDGVTLMTNDVLNVLDDHGVLATDAHLCKLDTSATTTTTEETTTTVEETTTTVEETTTTVEETTTTVEETTTTVEETTTTQPEEVTTTTDSGSGGPTTTTTLVEITTTTDSESGAVTTTLATELPVTGPDQVRAFMTFGALLILIGGVLVLRSRRDVEFG